MHQDKATSKHAGNQQYYRTNKIGIKSKEQNIELL
jgi:hypothetical protein